MRQLCVKNCDAAGFENELGRNTKQSRERTFFGVYPFYAVPGTSHTEGYGCLHQSSPAAAGLLAS